MASRFLFGHLAESFAELYGIVPGDVIDRVIVPYYAWFHGFDDLPVLEQHLTLKDAWVLSHDAKVLVLGYLVDPHVEAFGDSNLVRFLRWLGSWLTWLGSHRERARRDVGQLESDTGRHAFGWRQRLAAGKADCGNKEQNEDQMRRVAHWTDVQKRRLRAIGSPGEEPRTPW